MASKTVQSNLYNRHRANIVWKPLRDQLDVRYENILERCLNTNKRLQTVTCSDVLAEMAAALKPLNTDWLTTDGPLNWSSHLDSALVSGPNEILELDEPLQVLTVYSPENSFNLQTDATVDDGSCLPRTSTPLQLSWGSYNEDERRKIWMNRVLMKKPILFRTYGSHRFPGKSCKENHRQTIRRNRPRKVLIDDPRCRTPTPPALRISWSCLEDVHVREGILSSPTRIDFIAPDDQNLKDNYSSEEDDTFDEMSTSEHRPKETDHENAHDDTDSSNDFKLLQEEIMERVRQGMGEPDRQSPKVTTEVTTKVLLNANARSFLPASSTTDVSDNVPSASGTPVNRDVNDNVNDASSRACYSENTSWSCAGLQATSSIFFDSNHDEPTPPVEKPVQHPIPTITTDRRVDGFTTKRNNSYPNDCDYDNRLLQDGKKKRCLGSLSRCVSNPNLIVIIPDKKSNKKQMNKDEIKFGIPRRSNSTPNLSSVNTPPLSTPPNEMEEKDDQGDDLRLTQSSEDERQIDIEEEEDNNSDVTIDTDSTLSPNSESSTITPTNECSNSNLKNYQTNDVMATVKHDVIVGKMEYGDDSASCPRREFPNPRPLLDLDIIEGIRAKRKRFAAHSSFRGYCDNDKYHYYQGKDNRDGLIQIEHGTPSKGKGDDAREVVQQSIGLNQNQNRSCVNKTTVEFPKSARHLTEKPNQENGQEIAVIHGSEGRKRPEKRNTQHQIFNHETTHIKDIHFNNGTNVPYIPIVWKWRSNESVTLNDTRAMPNGAKNTMYTTPTGPSRNGPTGPMGPSRNEPTRNGPTGPMGPTGPSRNGFTGLKGSTTNGPTGPTMIRPMGPTWNGPMIPTRIGPTGPTSNGPVGPTWNGPTGPTRNGPMGPTMNGPTESTCPARPTRFPGNPMPRGPTYSNMSTWSTGSTGPNSFTGLTRPVVPTPLSNGLYAATNSNVRPPDFSQYPQGFPRMLNGHQIPFFTPFRYQGPPFHPSPLPGYGMLPTRQVRPQGFPRMTPLLY